MKAGAIVLAAGASRRFGSPKQLALLDGEQLLARAVRVCSEAGLHPVIVVLGSNADQIETSTDLRGAITIRNPEWEAGMALSIRVGVSALQSYDLDACVITTCDMPLVSSDHLRALVAKAERERSNIGSKGDRWVGVPACFLVASFPELMMLSGDAGARTMLEHVPAIELTRSVDVDTVEDLNAIRELFRT